MFKLVVLSALLALAAGKPSLTQVVLAPVAVPSAVSYQTRTDVVSKPVVETYAPVLAAAPAPEPEATVKKVAVDVPVVSELEVQTPAIKTAPLVKAETVITPAAYSYAYTYPAYVGPTIPVARTYVAPAFYSVGYAGGLVVPTGISTTEIRGDGGVHSEAKISA